MTGAIYVIEDHNGYLIYVGATEHADDRRRQHHRRWPDATFHVLEEDPPDGLADAERRWIADGLSWGWPLENRTLGGEWSAKISHASKGIPKTDEHRSKISAALTGVAKTDEHRTAISNSWTDKRRIALGKRNIALLKGVTQTDAHRMANSAAQMGHPVSNETRAKQRASALANYARACGASSG